MLNLMSDLGLIQAPSTLHMTTFGLIQSLCGLLYLGPYNWGIIHTLFEQYMFWSMTALGLIQISIIWTVHVLVHDSFGFNTDIMWTVHALVHEGCGSNPVMRWTVHVCVHNYFECKSGIMLTVYVLVHGSFGSNPDLSIM